MAKDRTPLRLGGARSSRKSIKRRYIPRLEALEDRAMPALPGFSIADVFVAETNSGTTAAQFRILLDQTASGLVRVNYSTADGGSATPGVDFTPTTGVAIFNPGETQQIITVPVVGDTLSEGAETFVINLSNASGGAIIVDNMAIATITDEEYATTAPVPPLNQDFGTGGTASQGTLTKGFDIAVDGNDRAVVLGGNSGASQVVRYNPNGTLDTTFGGSGAVNITTPANPGGVAAYTQGAFRDYVVVGGTIVTAPGGDIFVQRLNPDGTPDGAVDSTPDTKFGSNGFVTLDLGGDETVSDVEVKATGEVVVAGTTAGAGGSQAFVVVFNADGTVQSTTRIDVPGGKVTSVGDIAIDPAGNILIAGSYVDASNVTHGFTARVLATGGLDPSYGPLPVPGLDEAFGIAVSSTGQIVVSGETGESATLIGLKSSGAIDGAFGTNGVVTEPKFDTYNDVDFDAVGNLVVTGSNAGAADSAQVIARYKASGAPDATFNTSDQTAFIVIDQANIDEEGQKLAVAGNGQIFAVGTTSEISLSSMTTTSVLADRADIVATATTSSTNVVVGDTVTVTYTVTNSGPQASGEVTATGDVFNQTIVSSSVPFTQSGTTVTWQLGTLAPGQTVTFSVVYQETSIGLGAPALLVYGNIPDPDTTNNTASVTVFVGNITLSPAIIDENEPAGTPAGTVFSSDEEGTPLTLSVVPGAGDDLFAVDPATNLLVSLVPFNFEATPTLSVTIQGTTFGGAVYTKTFIITVLDVNDPPVANNDTVSTGENTPVTITNAFLRSNDTDEDAGATLTVLGATTAPTNGTLSPVAGGFVYQPAPGYSGPDSFTYSITDGAGTISTATVFINVVPFNDPPVGVDDSLIGTFEDSGPFVIPFSALTGNDSPGPGEAGQTLSIRSVNSAVGGTAAIVGTDVVFTPAANFNGTAQFNYVLVDSGGAVAVVDPLVSFLVRDVNDAPTGTPDAIGNIPEDSGPYVIPFSQLLANDGAGAPDEAGQTLTIVGVNSASGGTAVIVGTNVVFTPFPDYFGPASFTYVVQDNGFSQDSFDPRATAVPVTFTVTEVNDPPTAINLVLPTVSNFAFFPPASFAAGATTGPANEAGQTLTVVGVSNVVGGTVTLTSGGVVFVPNIGFTGVASFTYVLADNGTTAGAADPRTASAVVRFTVGSSLPSAAGALGNNNVTTLVVPGIPRTVDTLASSTARSGEAAAYVTEDTIRILMPPTPANRAATWGDVDARITNVVPLFQERTDIRIAGPSTVSPGELTGSPEAPRRGRLMQIVNSQFDGEDNVNIFEQLLTPPAAPAGGASPNVVPGGAALPANPAPLDAAALAIAHAGAEQQAAPVAAPAAEPPSWGERLVSFGMGLLLVAGFFGNLALAPVVDRRLFAEPKRKKRRK